MRASLKRTWAFTEVYFTHSVFFKNSFGTEKSLIFIFILRGFQRELGVQSEWSLELCFLPCRST